MREEYHQGQWVREEWHQRQGVREEWHQRQWLREEWHQRQGVREEWHQRQGVQESFDAGGVCRFWHLGHGFDFNGIHMEAVFINDVAEEMHFRSADECFLRTCLSVMKMQALEAPCQYFGMVFVVGVNNYIIHVASDNISQCHHAMLFARTIKCASKHIVKHRLDHGSADIETHREHVPLPRFHGRCDKGGASSRPWSQLTLEKPIFEIQGRIS